MAIPDRFLDELVARSEITDVASDYVSLKRKGDKHWALCPFHSEKTPSFSVSADQQAYYCFGCHKGGGVISFIMEIENLPFPDAVRFLAKRAGMEVPETGEKEAFLQRRQRLLALNKEAARFFFRQLSQPEGKAGGDYLARRGLAGETIRRFGLGFAPEGGSPLIEAMTQLGYQKSELLEAGLAAKSSDGRIYDRFRNRVMFPIIDLRGDVIGFGGRVLDDALPKYLNSPDSLVFQKSRNLFALNFARKSKQGRLILTEGYLDTISLHQAGFDGAVASLGTAFTPDHAKLLSRFAKEVVIAYDGDAAGTAAAQRAIPMLERTGMKVKVLRLRGAKDPDEFIKKFGREAFSKILDQSENHIEYRLDSIRMKYSLEDDAQKVAYLREAAELLASLDSPVEREVYSAKCAGLAGISPEAMTQEMKRALQQRLRQVKKKQERAILSPATQRQPKERQMRYEHVKAARAEEGILRLVLLDPILFEQTKALSGKDFTVPFLGKAFDLLRQRWQEGQTVSLAVLAGELSAEETHWLAGILQVPQAMERTREAMDDYLTVIETEAAKRTAGSEPDLLLAAQQKYKEKKGYGG